MVVSKEHFNELKLRLEKVENELVALKTSKVS